MSLQQRSSHIFLLVCEPSPVLGTHQGYTACFVEQDNRDAWNQPANHMESGDYRLPSLNPGMLLSFPRAMLQKSMSSVATNGCFIVFQWDRNPACALKPSEPLGTAASSPGWPHCGVQRISEPGEQLLKIYPPECRASPDSWTCRLSPQVRSSLFGARLV